MGKLKRMAAVTILASLLLLTVGSVAHAGSVKGGTGAESNSVCQLDRKFLKNEPGLCDRRSGVATVAKTTRPVTETRSSSDAILWIALAGTLALAGAGAGTVLAYRRRLHPAA